MIPRLISGWPNVADSAAIRKSQAIASSQPPPNAIELTAAIVTVDDRSIPRMKRWASSTSCAPSASGDIFVNSLMSAPALKVKMFDEAITSARALPSTASHRSIRSRDGLRRERVRRRPVQPGDRDVAAGLEQHGLALVAGVRLRVGEEALAGLLAEPALGDEPPQDRGRLEGVAPLRLGALELLEDRVEARLVGARERARAGCPRPSSSRPRCPSRRPRPPRGRGRTRPAS